jgi:hypothetical protein
VGADRKLDVVFNMVRFTEPMLGNADLAETCKPIGRDEEKMREFFMDRVRMDPLLDGQNYIYMHYADMIANGYHRLAPCPFQTQGIMLNPDGGLFFCENSDVVGNVVQEDAEAIYFRESSQKHRDWIAMRSAPGCLSPCQMNVSAVKQVMPYVQFLVRAAREKRNGAPPRLTTPRPRRRSSPRACPCRCTHPRPTPRRCGWSCSLAAAAPACSRKSWSATAASSSRSRSTATTMGRRPERCGAFWATPSDRRISARTPRAWPRSLGTADTALVAILDERLPAATRP